jgi:hypothetical protein
MDHLRPDGQGRGPRLLRLPVAGALRARRRSTGLRQLRHPDHRARLAAGRGRDDAPRVQGQRSRPVASARRRPARLHGHRRLAGLRRRLQGTVEPGRAADLCVLDRPLPGLDPHEITDAQVDLTVFDGRVVFGRCGTLTPVVAPPSSLPTAGSGTRRPPGTPRRW